MSEGQRLESLRKSMKDITGNDVPARRRIGQLLDPGSFVELDLLVGQGVVTGFGTIEQRPVYLYAQDVTVDQGAMGEGQSAKIARVMEMALDAGAPLVALCDSQGARLLEGAGAQDAYARIFAGHARLSGAVPQIALVLGDCVGSQAVAAQMCDFVVMSEDAYMNHLPPQVLAAKQGKDVDKPKLGGGSVNVKSGNAHFACPDEASAIGMARALLGILPSNSQEEANDASADDLNRPVAFGQSDMDIRQIAAQLADSNIVLESGAGAFDGCTTSLIRMGGRTVALIAAEDQWCSGAIYKAAAFVRKADAFNIPVVSLLNINNVYNPENQETVKALGVLAYAFGEATVPKVTLIAGKAYGPLYSALGARPSVDMVLAWPLATISPLLPEAAVDILYADELKRYAQVEPTRVKLQEKYLAEVASAEAAAKKGLVDAICEVEETRKTLIYIVDMLASKRIVDSPRKHGSL